MTNFNKLALLVILSMGLMLWAQSGTTAGLTSASTGAACAVVPGATGTLCTAGDGLWYAVGNGAFQKVFLGTPSAGVTSFNGRTGAVVPVVGDYPASGVTSFNGRSGAVLPIAGDYAPVQKPSFACSTSSVGNSGLSASGCN